MLEVIVDFIYTCCHMYAMAVFAVQVDHNIVLCNYIFSLAHFNQYKNINHHFLNIVDA